MLSLASATVMRAQPRELDPFGFPSVVCNDPNLLVAETKIHGNRIVIARLLTEPPAQAADFRIEHAQLVPVSLGIARQALRVDFQRVDAHAQGMGAHSDCPNRPATFRNQDCTRAAPYSSTR